MKNLRLIPALLIALIVTFQVSANPSERKTPEAETGIAYNVHAVKGQTKVMVSLNNPTDEKVTINIYDEQHHLLISETERKEEIVKMYDLSKVGKGHYTVEIKAGDLAIEKELDLGITTANTMPFTTGVYADKDAKNKMVVAFANAATGNVSIAIEDANGRSVYADYLNNMHSYTQRFNMQDLASGEYTVSITHNGKTKSHYYIVTK